MITCMLCHGQFATFLVSILVTWTSARTKDRSIHIICLMLVAAVGNAVATATTNVGARFFAMFLMPMGAISACKKTRRNSYAIPFPPSCWKNIYYIP